MIVPDNSMAICCHIDCDKEAEFEIQWNPPTPDNYTQACEGHVGALLAHRPSEPAPDHYRVYSLPRGALPTNLKDST